MQSADYLPGVAGWKIHDHVRLELNDGNRRIHAEVKMVTTAGPGQTNDEAAQAIRDLVLEAKAPVSSTVTACEGKISELGTRVAAQGCTVTALTNTITHESSARESADEALATHIGALNCNLQDNRADARATSFLTTRIASAEESTLEIDPGQTVEPLRIGTVVFRGEAARQIRAAQAVLRAAGAGQLEVVKRANEPGEPFFVIDGQVFVAKATVKSAAVEPSPYSVKVALDNEGRFCVAGVGIDASIVASELKLGPGLEKDVRRLLREELQPGGMLHRC
ncbi:hypothetical protein O4O02_09005 [Pseudomonas fortuita]|uniref:hypothetical protein n=1 Tax=Pseudomonas fortuita TaxID=3233375 RepID=UPI003D816C46